MNIKNALFEYFRDDINYLEKYLFAIVKDIPTEWQNILFNKKQTAELTYIFDILKKDIMDSFADFEHLFDFARQTTFSKLQVIILGPPKYKTICKNLIHNNKLHKLPKKNVLKIWGVRGILLLNSLFATKHTQIWSKYIDILIKNLANKINPGAAVFIFWYKCAMSPKSKKTLKMHYTIRCAHSCSDKYTKCGHLIGADIMLHKNIDWSPDIKEITAYTDGSGWPNKNTAEAKNGYAAVFTSGHLDNLVIYGTAPKEVVYNNDTTYYATATRAEGLAILYALDKCNSISADEWDKITIVSDSKLWVDIINTHMPRWIDEGRDFGTKKNTDITTRLWSVVLSLRQKGILDVRTIPSHGKKGMAAAPKNSKQNIDYINNDLADHFANCARKHFDYGIHEENNDLIKNEY